MKLKALLKAIAALFFLNAVLVVFFGDHLLQTLGDIRAPAWVYSLLGPIGFIGGIIALIFVATRMRK